MKWTKHLQGAQKRSQHPLKSNQRSIYDATSPGGIAAYEWVGMYVLLVSQVFEAGMGNPRLHQQNAI